MSEDREHRWGAVVVRHLDAAQAEHMASLDEIGRLDMLASIVLPEGQLPQVQAVRGPICVDCRVAWEDVHRTNRPWPCPGVRPDDLGGPLLDPTASRLAPNRQQLRAKARKAEKATKATRNRQAASAAVAKALGAAR